MTHAEFEALLSTFELVAPVTMDDLAEIKRQVDKHKAAGIFSEVVLRDDRVEVCLYGGTTVRAWLSVRPA